jgi:hypothetical protein
MFGIRDPEKIMPEPDPQHCTGILVPNVMDEIAMIIVHYRY